MKERKTHLLSIYHWKEVVGNKTRPEHLMLVPEKRRTPCCNDTLHFGGWTNSDTKERCSGS